MSSIEDKPLPKKKLESIENLVTYPYSYKEMFDALVDTGGALTFLNFEDFVQTVFTKSYPEYNFNVWHVRKLCALVDEVFRSDKKFLEAVLPRYHLKSTILGYAAHIYRTLVNPGDGMYISYKDELANYHLSNIKKSVRENEILSRELKDLSLQSDTVFNYKVHGKRSRIFSAGILAMKRGIHTDTLVVADDILGDLQNPMSIVDLEKVKRLFNAEIINIPNKECPLFVFGTVISDQDLLYSLKENSNFRSIWLPAEYPDSEHRVLWEERYPLQWLMDRRGETPAQQKAYSTEFLLTPVLAAGAYLTREDLAKVVNRSLKNYSYNQQFLDKGDKHIVAGFDVGKRRNPSHLSIFIDDDNGNLIMIHQSFWDGLEYNDQVDRLTRAIENFRIDRLYWDATRGELEDRNLPRQCVPIKFTGRGMRNQDSYAVDFANRVALKTVKLIDDDRFIGQITSVSNDFKAVESPLGHGDSFWSCALAIGCYQDFYAKNKKRGFSYMGDIQEVLEVSMTGGNKEKAMQDERLCKVCGNRHFEILPDNRKKCTRCFAVWGK